MMIPKQGPKGPDDRDVGKTPASEVLFDKEEWGREWSGPVGWLRYHRSLSMFMLVLVLAAAWWAYRTYWHTRVPAGQEVPPTQPVVQTPGVPEEAGVKAGVKALSDSVLSLPPGTPTALTARAVGPEGPLANRLMRFSIVEGSGVLGRDTVRTDAEGLARAALVLPTVPGRVVVTAELEGSSLPGARFLITVRPRAPRRALIVGGSGQTAFPGSLLPQRLSVRVMDAQGEPVPGVEVRFQVVGGGGVVAPSRVETDASGYASAQWRLGGAPGDQHVAALVPDIGDVLLTFDATAVSSSSQSAREPEVESVTVVPRSFAVGGSFVCALAGSRVSCRGGNDRGQRLQASPAGFAAIAAGVSHACALTGDGQAFCWGANDSGQLGDGSRIDRARPVQVATNNRFSMLAAGVSYTCGLAAGGRALCWGESIGGQGDDTPSDSHLTPHPVAGDHRFVQLVAGWYHVCGLTVAGNAYCWGRNDRGQLGNGTHADRGEPTLVPGTFQSLAAGNAHTCGIRGGAVLCWGDNSSGQLGDGTTQSRAFPAPVEGLPARPVRLAAGAVSTCALLSTNRVFCWGQNVHGELGDGTRENHSTPVPVAGDLSFRSIYAGGALTCGFTDDGTQYCWGLNQSGQLGDGTRESRSTPKRVGG